MNRSRLLLSRILRALWFRPALYAAAALAVLLVAPSVATLLPNGLMKLIGLQGVYDLLNALANTLLSVAIFSLGILAASMRSAAQGATPRVRPFLAEDPTARNAISTFIGGFVFSVAGIVILSTGYYSDAAKVLMFFHHLRADPGAHRSAAALDWASEPARGRAGSRRPGRGGYAQGAPRFR